MMRYLLFFLVFCYVTNAYAQTLVVIPLPGQSPQDPGITPPMPMSLFVEHPNQNNMKAVAAFDFTDLPTIPQGVTYNDLSVAQKMALLVSYSQQGYFSPELMNDRPFFEILYYALQHNEQFQSLYTQRLQSGQMPSSYFLNLFSYLNKIPYWYELQFLMRINWDYFLREPSGFAKSFPNAYVVMLRAIDRGILPHGTMDVELPDLLSLISNAKKAGYENHVLLLLKLAKHLGLTVCVESSGHAFDVRAFQEKVEQMTADQLWLELGSFKTKGRPSLREKIRNFMAENKFSLIQMEFLLRYLWLKENKRRSLTPLMHSFYDKVPYNLQKGLGEEIKALIALLPPGTFDSTFAAKMINSKNFVIESRPHRRLARQSTVHGRVSPKNQVSKKSSFWYRQK